MPLLHAGPLAQTQSLAIVASTEIGGGIRSSERDERRAAAGSGGRNSDVTGRTPAIGWRLISRGRPALKEVGC